MAPPRYPAPSYYQYASRPPAAKVSPAMIAVIVGGVVLILGAILVVIALGSAPAPPAPCPPPCRVPPNTVPPLPPPASYTSSATGFSIEYEPDRNGRLAVGSQDDHGIQFLFARGTSAAGVFTFAGEKSGGKSPEQLVAAVQARLYPNATRAYVIPRADVGAVTGYGAIYDVQIQAGTGTSVHGRAMVVAAVRGGVAVEVSGLGPYYATTRSDGHPNPADTKFVLYLDPILETVRWPGDAPR